MNQINETVITDMCTHYENILQKYKEYESLIGHVEYDNLINFINNYNKKIKINLAEKKVLKIGIVGQIKAGKSSFLNAFLFDGNELLPKAATPMTAALTRIGYSEKPEAEIEFYTKLDWEVIEECSRKYKQLVDETRQKIIREKEESQKGLLKSSINKILGKESDNKITITDAEIQLRLKIPEEIQAAYELCLMVQKLNLDVSKYLGTTKKIENVNNVEDIVGKLKDYVGAEGRFTPLVKSSRLLINDKSLENIEVIDTPGVNDPIVSRGAMTKKFLAECDVVFLLCYSGQFMDNTDIGILIEKIPNEGIRNILLLGSKFDSVLLDEGEKYKEDIKKAIYFITQKLEKQAENILNPIFNCEPNNIIFQNIKKSMPPKFISSMAYSIMKNYNSLNKEQEHILGRLKKTFPNTSFEPNLLNKLANIENIKNDQFKIIREQKLEIFQNRISDLIVGQNRELKGIFAKIYDEMKLRLDELMSSDKKSVSDKYLNIKNSIKKANVGVQKSFDNLIVRIDSRLGMLKSQIKDKASEYKRIQTKEESKTIRYKESTSSWWNPFSWGSYEWRSYVENFRTASVHEAVEKISLFVAQSEINIKNEIEGIVDFKGLKTNLIKAVINVFDLSNESFDENVILFPVEKAINQKVNFSDIEFSDYKYLEKIRSKFNKSTLTDDEIDDLIKAQAELISEILSDINETINNKHGEMKRHLENCSNIFITEIENNINETVNNLKKQLDEKILYEKLYNELLKLVSDDLNKIKRLEDSLNIINVEKVNVTPNQ